jgi:hypothetical protein
MIEKISRKNYKFFFLFLVFGIIVFPLTVIAATGIESREMGNPLGTTDFNELITKIIDWLANIGALIAVIMIIYSGFLFMTSGGNEEKVTKAKKALTWSLVGLAVLIIGKGWVLIVKDVLGIQ